MNGCYIGRGSLLVSVMGASRGFFTLSGESEVTLEFDEDNESVFDARNGKVERVDWYIRGQRARITAQCYRVEKDALTTLLKAHYTAVGVDATPIALPNPVVVGDSYLLRPNITPGSVVVTDSVAAVVGAGNYTVEEAFGLITFSAIPGVQPYSVTLSSAGHAQYALLTEPQIIVEAVVKGLNRITGKEFLAHFYRLAFDITEEMKLVSQGFNGMTVRMHAMPDPDKPLDPQLGQFGRIILL